MVDERVERAPKSVREVVYDPAFRNMPAQAKETFLDTVADEMEEHGDEAEALRSAWDALAVIYGAEGREEGFEEILPTP
jgi:hypothetical protein